MYNNLPLYELKFDDVFADTLKMSLVNSPAVQVEFLKFAVSKMAFAIDDADRQVVYGIAMIPDVPIYRCDDNMGAYYIKFSADTIAKIEKYFLKKSQFNIDHAIDTESIEVLESFLINRELGVVPSAFSDYPDGTWVLKAHVISPEIWSEVKSGKLNGFSLESILSYDVSKFANQNYHNSLMTLKQIKIQLAHLLTKCGAVTVKDASGAELTLEFAESEIANGTEVFVADESGNLSHPADGSYVADTLTIDIKDGIATIKDRQPEVPEQQDQEKATAMADVQDSAKQVPSEAQGEPEDLGARLDDLSSKIDDMSGVLSSLSELVGKYDERIANIEATICKIQDTAPETVEGAGDEDFGCKRREFGSKAAKFAAALKK